jgi:[acyl-carrier-protein] S-malonyltransferase
LQAVNYNCPGQTVVAGDEENLSKFMAYCKENRIKAVRLPVGGAFHSRAMENVSGLIFNFINPIDFFNPICPVYSNLLARPYKTEELKEVLAKQTSSPVYFEQTLVNLLQNGFDAFVEVGPGNTLSGFIKRMGQDVAIYNISDTESLALATEGLKEKK